MWKYFSDSTFSERNIKYGTYIMYMWYYVQVLKWMKVTSCWWKYGFKIMTGNFPISFWSEITGLFLNVCLQLLTILDTLQQSPMQIQIVYRQNCLKQFAFVERQFCWLWNRCCAHVQFINIQRQYYKLYMHLLPYIVYSHSICAIIITSMTHLTQYHV